jgi:hypothetical protein
VRRISQLSKQVWRPIQQSHYDVKTTIVSNFEI